MKVVGLSDALGVELLDFDIKGPCRPEEQAELRRLFCEHHLIAIRGQDVTEEDQTRFVGNFGPIHILASGRQETYVTNRDERVFGVGTARLLWHSDGTYGLRPGIATSLWAAEVFPDSVPTMYTNAVRVLERLPDDLRARIEPLHVVHLRDTHIERTDQRWREEEIPPDAVPGRFVSQEHPIVYRMPHTDQKTLLVNELLASHVVELPRDEGEALLQQLFARLYAPENVYTHVWQTNDLIIWDNLALQHCRPADMGRTPRHLRRQSLDGWYTDEGVLDWRETAVAYAGVAPSSAN